MKIASLTLNLHSHYAVAGTLLEELGRVILLEKVFHLKLALRLQKSVISLCLILMYQDIKSW